MASIDPPGRGLLGNVRQALRGALRHPPLDITVVVPGAGDEPPRGRFRPPDPPLDPADQTVAQAVSRAVGEHTRALGVPAQPVVTVKRSSGSGTIPRLVFSGRRVRVPTVELDAALAARGLAPLGHSGSGPLPLATVAATASAVAIEHNPAVLVGRPQRDELLSRARAAGIRGPADDVLWSILERVVAHGHSVGDLGAVRTALGGQVGLAHTAAELAEAAMDAPAIEIRLSEATLRAATTTPGGMRRQAFVEMRRRLFRDIGVTLPDVAVTIDTEVPDAAAAVRLNDVCGAPRPLPGGVGVAPIVELLEQRVRSHPSWFVCMAEVHRTIEELKLALPDLVAAVLDRYGEPQLSLFARTFVEERVPVRNAARLMIILLDVPPPSSGHDVVRLAESTRRAGVRPKRPGARGLVSYARQQINEEAARSRPGLTTIEHPRLPAELESALAAIPIGDAGVAVRSADLHQLTAFAEGQLEAAQQRDDDRTIMLSATQHSRSVAVRLLAGQYPDLAVLATEEFPPSCRMPPANAPAS